MSRDPKPVRRVAAALLLCAAIGGGACRKGLPIIGKARTATPERGDALFLAEAPAVVPDELSPDLDAMGVRRFYVAAASLSPSGRLSALPPPPSPIQRPVVLVLMGEPGAENGLRGGPPELLGEAWSSGVKKLVADAKGWAKVAGVHFHLFPQPSDAPALAKALAIVKSGNPGVTLSVTLRAGAPAGTWTPLVGSADEALVFCFGRRPEAGDTFVREMSGAEAKAFPLPFRLLLVPGGYGVAGTGASAHRLSDGEVDRLSEDRNLDFDFAAVLSSEPGSIYNFKPRAGYEKERNLLSQYGGRARFDLLPFGDLVRFVSASARWSAPRLAGRVFLVDGVPADGHLAGYPAIRALLTGKPWEPSLTVEPVEGKGRGGEVWLRVWNPGPTPSELTRFGNQITIRLEGGVFTALGAGDFDRYEIYASAKDMKEPAPFGRATACRLYENFFSSGESNEVGPIRVAGARPRAFVSYQLTLPDGRTLNGAEAEVAIAPPPPPTPEAKAKKKAQPPIPKLRSR